MATKKSPINPQPCTDADVARNFQTIHEQYGQVYYDNSMHYVENLFEGDDGIDVTFGDTIIISIDPGTFPSDLLDVKVKVSADDTTTNYLVNKTIAGVLIELSEFNDGGDEALEIKVKTDPSPPTATEDNKWLSYDYDNDCLLFNDPPEDKLVAVDSGNTPNYLIDCFQYVASGDYDINQDALIYAEKNGSSPNETVKLFLDCSLITDYDAGERQYLMHDASGILRWVTASACP